jgi:hypothetical protein
VLSVIIGGGKWVEIKTHAARRSTASPGGVIGRRPKCGMYSISGSRPANRCSTPQTALA